MFEVRWDVDGLASGWRLRPWAAWATIQVHVLDCAPSYFVAVHTYFMVNMHIMYKRLLNSNASSVPFVTSSE